MSDIILILFVGLCICITGSLVAWHNILLKKKIELVSWAILFCTIFYGIGFPFVFISTYFGKNVPMKTSYIITFDHITIIYYGILVCILMISIYIGWSLVKNKNFVLFKNNGFRKTIENNYLHKLIRFAWFLLFLSFITYYLYSMAYGGFFGLLSYTKSIRAGVSELPNQFSFFKQFGQFSIISAFIFFGLVIDNTVKNKYKTSCLIGAIISGLFSLYVLYSWGGRGAIVLFIFVYILGSIYNKSDLFFNVIKKNIKYIPIIPLMFIIIDRIWESSRRLDLLTLIVDSISYPFIAFISNFYNSSYRWLQDFLYIPFYFLPSSIWQSKLNIETANSYTTYLVSGARKGEVIGNRLITGTTPNDLLAFGYMQADFIGVFIIGLFLGIFLRILHNKIMVINVHGIKIVLYSFCIVHFAIKSIAGGDVSQLVISNWAFFVSAFLYYIYIKFRVRL